MAKAKWDCLVKVCIFIGLVNFFAESGHLSELIISGICFVGIIVGIYKRFVYPGEVFKND